MEGEPRLVLTGQLGDVMKESAQIALSYLRSHAETLGIELTASPEGPSTCTSRQGPYRRTGRRRASPW